MATSAYQWAKPHALFGLKVIVAQPVQPIARPILQPGIGGSFNPAIFFASGEQGAWYDPSDFSTMFQDYAGTTPVTAVEQPVGLMLDKSKGLVLGSELVTNSGGPFVDTTGWTSTLAGTTGLSVVGGKLQFSTGSSGGRITTTLSGLTVGATYKIAVGAQTGTNGLPSIRVTTGSDGTTGALFIQALTGSAYTYHFTATATTLYLSLLSLAFPNTITIESASTRLLPGNHAFQATATSRPVLSARYNLLTNTETLATQSVTTMATTQRLRFEGTGTITLSGTATGTYSAGSHTFTTTAGTLTLTVSGTVTKADLRAANDALNQPAYQRVNTATDYDTTGFKPYLRFDGTDDWLQTNSVDFTATDKMTVFAGVRKLSDAARGVLAELSASTEGNAGSFVLTAPEAATSNYGFGSRGSILNSPVAASPFAAPITNVLTGVGNISGDSVILRVNGAQSASDTADQGTGNYGNYPLYIGRRGGSTLPFNGRLYGLIVRGAQSTAQQIANTENWLNQRTGAF